MHNKFETLFTFSGMALAAVGFGLWQHNVGAGIFIFFGFLVWKATS